MPGRPRYRYRFGLFSNLMKNNPMQQGIEPTMNIRKLPLSRFLQNTPRNYYIVCQSNSATPHFDMNIELLAGLINDGVIKKKSDAKRWLANTVKPATVAD